MDNHGTITAQGGTLAVHNGWLTGDGTLAITTAVPWIFNTSMA